jgi:leader peptidase (prepilin peptidase)/N-methyltransferase
MLADFIFYFIFFVFGTIVGSFLNVIILRYNTGVSALHGRSFCFSCGHKLSWSELVPVLSYIFQSGRCRHCESRISSQYPLVETVTGLFFVAIFIRYGSIWGLFDNYLLLINALIVTSILISIAVYDIKHKIIPDALVVALSLLSFLQIFIERFFYSADIYSGSLLIAFLAGPILALPLFLIWLVSRGQWMGLGDPKLVLFIGWFLGLRQGVSALVLAFWTGAIYGLILIGLSKFKWHGLSVNRRSEIPFAPFLILGFFLVFFFGLEVFVI